MKKMTNEQKQLYNRIDEILFEDWNPIGFDMPRDEYSGYTPQIFQLKIQGADSYKIADKLYKYETINMGLIGNTEMQMDNCKSIAEKIIEL